MQHNRKEVREEYKKRKELHKTKLFPFGSHRPITLTPYQCKPEKNVALWVVLHPDIQVSSNKNPKKKHNWVLHSMTLNKELTYMIKWGDFILWNQEVDGGLCVYFIMLLIQHVPYQYLGHVQARLLEQYKPQRIHIKGGRRIDTEYATCVLIKTSSRRVLQPSKLYNATPAVKQRLMCFTSKCRNHIILTLVKVTKHVCDTCACKMCK